MIEILLTRRVAVSLSVHNWFVGVHYHWEDETLTLGVLPMLTVRWHCGPATTPAHARYDDRRWLSADDVPQEGMVCRAMS